MDGRISTRDILSLYHLIMEAPLKIVQQYRDRNRYFVELSRPLSGPEQRRLLELENRKPEEWRTSTLPLIPLEADDPELVAASAGFCENGVLVFSVPSGEAGEYAERRLLKIEEYVKLLNAELHLAQDRRAAEDEARERERVRERGLNDALVRARRRREP